MKDKKNNRFGKVLMVMTSAVLVAAVSVYGTLAFLTAQTVELKNTFTATTGVKGEVQEPGYPGDGTGATEYKYSFGTPVTKDPLVQNTGTNDMYTGLRLDFYLDATGGGYVQVPYSTFAKYVTVTADQKNATTDDFNTNYWTEEVLSGTPDYKIFTYRPKGTAAFTVVKAQNGENAVSGDYRNKGDDNTYPIFNSVQVKDEVNIVSLPGDTGYFAPEDAGNYNVSDVSTLKLKQLKFEIKVTGHGVLADTQNKSTNDTTAINSAILTDLKNGLTA